MEKRTRCWRRRQAMRVFKSRLKWLASITGHCRLDDGTPIYRPTWKDLYKEQWAQIYRATGTPCSCWMCKGESYNRLESKREARRILEEEDM